ncbi:hypothetical protein BV22DRAFT_545410 [Leucogyrophana mollusca]|uniref:Uncharacterized protein n=1 Tax=Leucogyrophana mollusca TaxID=85980 RepID=A0ACB8BEC5_9AGAM|nr:hypothetical protein BV22DRAFT_545410 [Leucogyrophana mollusca]
MEVSISKYIQISPWIPISCGSKPVLVAALCMARLLTFVPALTGKLCNHSPLLNRAKSHSSWAVLCAWSLRSNVYHRDHMAHATWYVARRSFPRSRILEARSCPLNIRPQIIVCIHGFPPMTALRRHTYLNVGISILDEPFPPSRLASFSFGLANVSVSIWPMGCILVA